MVVLSRRRQQNCYETSVAKEGKVLEHKKSDYNGLLFCSASSQIRILSLERACRTKILFTK